MSRTVAFGRDLLGASDVDIEDLLACLSPAEVQALLDELAGDPDDKHVPPSVRNSYRCEKDPTGNLDRLSLITHINEEAINSPDKEEAVQFELGLKRGKVFEPKYNEEELESLRKQADIEEKVRLDPEEESVLGSASIEDIMALADILNTNPQNFIMEAYADPLKYFEPDPPNHTKPKEVLESLSKDDTEVKDVCLNNVGRLEEKEVCDIFDTLRTNSNLTKLSIVNCEINDFSISTLCLALENNSSLKSINLESNRISPDSIAELFETLASRNNGILEVRISGQSQQRLGFRVESRIGDAISRNPRLLRISLDLQFPEVLNRVSKHLISNMDKIRVERMAKGEKSEVKWTPCKTIA